MRRGEWKGRGEEKVIKRWGGKVGKGGGEGRWGRSEVGSIQYLRQSESMPFVVKMTLAPALRIN